MWRTCSTSPGLGPNVNRFRTWTICLSTGRAWRERSLVCPKATTVVSSSVETLSSNPKRFITDSPVDLHYNQSLNATKPARRLSRRTSPARCALRSASRMRPEVAHDGMPERLAEAVDCKNGGRDRRRLQALDAFRTPVHIRETEPESKLVECQSQRNAKHHGDAEVPGRVSRGKRDESGDHQEQNAPEQMMNVQAAGRDHIPKRAVR